MSVIPRVVLAGGKASAELAAQIGTSVRAAAMFQGRRLLDIVVDALIEADPLSPVCVVGDVSDHTSYTRIADQGDYVSNLFAGVAVYAGADWLLVTSADIPFLSGPAVEEFCSAARTLAAATRADIVYPIVPVSECYARYPGIKRTAIKLREGEFTGGNIMLARPSFLLEKRDLIGRAFAARKDPLRLAWMLGLGTVARLFVSQVAVPGALTLELLEKRVGSLVGGRVAALICSRPEIATDLDRASDFAHAVAHGNVDRPASGG